MKIGTKQVIFIIAGALLLGSQAQAKGFEAANSAGLKAGAASVTCNGFNGHPSSVVPKAAEATCTAIDPGLLRATPRYNVTS